MKLNFLPVFIFIATLVLLVSCGPQGGKELSDYPNATTGDSMIYYYAQLRAHEYWKAAMKDTTLRSAEQRRQYIEGVKAGLDAVRMNQKYDTYNRGVRRGAQMAIRFLYFQDTYGIDLNEDILIESLSYGLQKEENAGSEFYYQNEFYRMYDRVKEAHRADLEKENKINLEEEAKKLDLQKIRSDLYYRITVKGNGPYPHKGNVIYMNIDYQLPDGTDLGMPSPERLTLGAPGMPEVMELAYMHLNKGASAIFATTADAVFGQRTEIIGLQPDDVLIVRLTINDIVDGSSDDEYEHPHAF